jgi:hypothetical protein
MRCLGVRAGVVLAAAVLGCGEGKKLPDEVVKPQITHIIPPDPLGPAPAASEPAAKAVLERAVKAITQGDPARLAGVKASVATYTGGVHFPNAPTITDATLRLEAKWPDRAVITFDFKGVLPTITFRLVQSDGWMSTGGREQPGKPADVGQRIYTEIVAKYSVPLGLPFADTRTIAFETRKEPGGTTVKVAPPGTPILLVTFDEKSGLPVRVECYPLEDGRRVPKVSTLADHKPQGGLLLPTLIELTQNGLPAEKWTLEKWEFPEKIDDSRFDAPK